MRSTISYWSSRTGKTTESLALVDMIRSGLEGGRPNPEAVSAYRPYRRFDAASLTDHSRGCVYSRRSVPAGETYNRIVPLNRHPANTRPAAVTANLNCFAAARSEWTSLKSVAEGNLHVFDGSAFFDRCAPRLIDSLEQVAGPVLAFTAGLA